MALKFIDYNYRIANIEPSIDSNKRIFYREGEVVGQGIFSFKDWEDKATYFSPQYGSSLATVYELLLWYAYRIAMGYWSLEYICDDSSSEGNYWNSPVPVHGFEPAGIRKVGGFLDGVGNTYKIVKNPEGGFSLCGGYYINNGNEYPVAEVLSNRDVPNNGFYYGSGVLVLKDKNVR